MNKEAHIKFDDITYKARKRDPNSIVVKFGESRQSNVLQANPEVAMKSLFRATSKNASRYNHWEQTDTFLVIQCLSCCLRQRR